jgi:glycosyltransferase involved in cell wall biosynthesis
MEISDLEIIIMGSSTSFNNTKFKFKTHYLGKFVDETSLAIVYNCADVFVLPSLQETLSQSLCESLSCGTPVVAFNHTGNIDIVDHKINGYLANNNDITDFYNGILWVINNLSHDKRTIIRNSLINKFSLPIIIPKYINFYNKILNKE